MAADTWLRNPIDHLYNPEAWFYIEAHVGAILIGLLGLKLKLKQIKLARKGWCAANCIQFHKSYLLGIPQFDFCTMKGTL